MAITIDEMIAELKIAKKAYGGKTELAWDQYGVNGYASPVDGITDSFIKNDETGETFLLIDIPDESFEYTEVDDE